MYILGTVLSPRILILLFLSTPHFSYCQWILFLFLFTLFWQMNPLFRTSATASVGWNLKLHASRKLCLRLSLAQALPPIGTRHIYLESS